MDNHIGLQGDQWNLIYKDQLTWLNSRHKGKFCLTIQACPHHHFDVDCDPNEIADRQEIMQAITNHFSDD